MAAVLAHQAQAIQTGHDQVLEDDSRFDADRLGNRLVGVGTKVEVDVVLARQPPAYGFADHGLIIHQQDHRGFFVARLEVVEL
ncbi:hypothetical protein D3C73_750220 [compost metagenome]